MTYEDLKQIYRIIFRAAISIPQHKEIWFPEHDDNRELLLELTYDLEWSLYKIDEELTTLEKK